MDPTDSDVLERLRRLGATEQLKDGEDGVRLTVQYRGRPTIRDRKAWGSVLQEWEHQLTTKVRALGGTTVEGSLSVSAQTVEIVVPAKGLDNAVRLLSDQDLGIRLQEARKIDPNY